MTAQHGGRRFRIALVRHVQDVDLGLELEELAGQMTGVADPKRSV
jgi:hypothetical protein